MIWIIILKGRWPISSLAVDRTHFYWTDAKERRVHKIRRFQNIVDHTDSSSLLGPVSAQIHRSEVLVELANVYKVVTFGTNFQPLPSQYFHSINRFSGQKLIPFFRLKISSASFQVSFPTELNSSTVLTIVWPCRCRCHKDLKNATSWQWQLLVTTFITAQ